MKFLRFLLLGLGVVVLLLAIVSALALLPSIQTWAARRVIASSPELGITHLGRVSAGFQRIEILDLRMQRDGLSLTLPAATIDLPVFSAARDDVQIRSLTAKGWTLDLTAPPSTADRAAMKSSAADASSFEGVFNLLQLPVDLAIESADVEGVVIFPTKTGSPAGRARVALTGGQLGTGREGRFTLKTEADIADGVAPVTRIENTSLLRLRMDTPRTFTRVSVTNETSANGPGLPQGARLHAEAAASREGDRESYEVLLKNMTGSAEKNLVELHASNPAAGQAIAGTWSVALTDADLIPYALGHALPAFTFSGDGAFQAARDFNEVRLHGKTDTLAGGLEMFSPVLAALGSIRARADFDLVHRDSGLRINRLAADVEGEAPIATVQILQAVEVVPATGEIKVADPQTDLFKVSLKGMPLAWAQPFLPEGLAITGDDVTGEFVALARQGGFTVRTTSPLSLDNLAIAQAGEALIDPLVLTVSATGDYRPGGWQADVSKLQAQSRGATLLTLSARAGQAGAEQPVKATGSFQADLPAWLSQPVAAGFASLESGTAGGEFTASIAPELQQVSSRLTITALRTKEGKALPAITADLRADQHADGRLETHAPLVFDFQGRKSDLEITAGAKPAGGRWDVDAQLVSRELFLEDLQAFAALQPPPQAAPPSTPGRPVPPSTPANKPVWDAVTGQVKVALKKVVYAANQPPVEIATSVKIAPDTLTLESISAVFPDGATANAQGVIKFDASNAEPYRVDISAGATNFDPQPFLKAVNPDKPPTVEGKFDFNGKITGQAAALDQVADKATIDAQLVSRGGTFHGFATSALAANIGKLQEGGSKLGSLLSVAGSVLGNSDSARLGEKIRAASDTVKRLGNFNFDQLNIDIAHRAGEASTQIKNFSLISPDMRLLGGGSIDSASGWRSLLQSAMKLDLQMAVRGAQAEDLRILDLLKREADELGYTAIAERFPVKGTAAQMDGSALIQLITSQIRRLR